MRFNQIFATELQEPTTKQYFSTCPENAAYTSTMAAESFLVML